MKGAKEEEKLMGPMFPRLHISDADKGGPRAPPRNKMALYEQLSIPSQAFTSGSGSMLPLPPNNSGCFIPSTSSVQGAGQKRSMYSSFCNSPDASNFAERFHSYPSGGMNLNATSMHVDWQPMEPTNGQALKAAGKFSLTANFSFPQVHCTSNSKNSSAKKFGEEDNFRVLAFVQSGSNLNFSNGQHNMEKEKTTTSSPNRHLQTGNVKQLKQTSITDLMPKQHGKNQTEGDSKMFPSCQDHSRWPIPILTSSDKFLLDSSLSPLARDRISGLERGGVVSLSEEKRRSLIDNSSRLRDLHQEYRALQEKIALRGDVLDRDGLSCTQTSHGDNHGSPNATEMVNGCHEDQCGSLLVRQADRNADISDTSIVDSISHVEISPDDVVGVIGQKQFWRARRAISQLVSMIGSNCVHLPTT